MRPIDQAVLNCVPRCLFVVACNFFCNNKSAFKEWAQGLGLKTVPLATGVPAFIKPKVIEASKLIHDQQFDLCNAPSEWYIVEEFIGGILLSMPFGTVPQSFWVFCRQTNASGFLVSHRVLPTYISVIKLKILSLL